MPLTKTVVQELKLQLLRRKGTTWVFLAPQGGPLKSSEFDTKFRAWADNVGLNVTFHDLRHPFASLMVGGGDASEGAPRVDGSPHMSITMELYTHLQDSQRKDAIEALETMISKQ